MRILKKLVWTLGIVLFFSTTFAYGAKLETKKNMKNKKTSSTDLSFEDLLVHGKYHFSDEAAATVEGDKILDALLGIRKDFKDRIEKSASHH